MIYSIIHIKEAARVLGHLKTSDCQLYMLNTPYIILFYENCSPQAKDFSWITIFPSFLSKTFVFFTHFCINFHPQHPPPLTWVWTPVGGCSRLPPHPGGSIPAAIAKDPLENLHISFLKWNLGVGKKHQTQQFGGLWQITPRNWALQTSPKLLRKTEEHES